MPILFLRHGESEANKQGVFAGKTNNAPLTPLGIEQAKAAAADLAGRHIDRIYTSPLTRAHQTALAFTSAAGLSPELVQPDDRITEYDMGSLTGTPYHQITSAELVAATGAEDPTSFQARVLDFLREYKDAPGYTLLVSHAGVGRIIEASKRGIDPAEFYNLPHYPNAHLVELELDWLREGV